MPTGALASTDLALVTVAYRYSAVFEVAYRTNSPASMRPLKERMVIFTAMEALEPGTCTTKKERNVWKPRQCWYGCGSVGAAMELAVKQAAAGLGVRLESFTCDHSSESPRVEFHHNGESIMAHMRPLKRVAQSGVSQWRSITAHLRPLAGGRVVCIGQRVADVGAVLICQPQPRGGLCSGRRK